MDLLLAVGTIDFWSWISLDLNMDTTWLYIILITGQLQLDCDLTNYTELVRRALLRIYKWIKAIWFGHHFLNWLLKEPNDSFFYLVLISSFNYGAEQVVVLLGHQMS